MRLLLLGDVMTTGSTANECSQVLLRAGAKEVLALTRPGRIIFGIFICRIS
jgi:predicted amidophosphoribosyltransferase